METVNILNTSLHNISQSELLEKLSHFGGFVITPNVEHLMKLQKDRDFFRAYQQANYRVCDSKIIQLVSRFLGNPIREKISGSDFFPAFYQYHKDNKDIEIFLLGAKEGVAKIARDAINQKVGREIIVDSYSPPFGFEQDEQECQKIIEKVDRSGATVLAMGISAPKQEKWIAKYKGQLKGVRIFLGIGATIDFEAGHKSRSPKWMSEVGLEWFYRLLCEPKRLWRRYLLEGLPFFWLVLMQKLNLYRYPTATSSLVSLSSRSPNPQSL